MNVAIIGRPNVGKSALFNRLAGRRIAIVHGQPGITRDRISVQCQIGEKSFKLWDTGGIGGAGETELKADVRASADRTMKESDLILFVVDGQDGLNPIDRELARVVRKLQKPVVLLVNKIDDPKHDSRADEFTALGFDMVLSISAAHGRGVAELLETIDQLLPSRNNSHERSTIEHSISVALVGRPNAGKSSLINAFLRDRHTIVSEKPGTTRDAIDIEYERDGRHYSFIDTAGIRSRSRHSSSVEVFSVMRAEKTIKRADICVLVIDAAAGIKAQDRRVAALIQKAHKACLIVLNKWDLMRTSEGQRQRMEDAIVNARTELFFIAYAPVLVTSGLTGEHADRVFTMIERIRRASRAHIGTGRLNRALRAAFAANPPPMVKGKRLKLFYATQSGETVSRRLSPPKIVLFLNSPMLLPMPYARFLESIIRQLEPYPGLPILLTCRARSSASK